MKFDHVFKELTIYVTDVTRSNAFATFSILGILETFHTGESVFAQFDRDEQEEVVSCIITKLIELGEDYKYFRVETKSSDITVAASNTEGYDSLSVNDCISKLFFILHDTLTMYDENY